MRIQAWAAQMPKPAPYLKDFDDEN